MTGIRQIEVVSEFLDVFYKEDTLLLVDPVLGDNGSSYGFYTSRMGEAMKALAERADIVTPNLTELCFLTGSCYEEIMTPLTRRTASLWRTRGISTDGLRTRQRMFLRKESRL